MPTAHRVRDGLATAGGAALGATFRAVGAVRPAAKPLHPRGTVVEATLHRLGLRPPIGVGFLDEEGTDRVLVRQSRATGLPTWLPDVHGLALRVPVEGGHADLLLASTGWGAVTRFVLTAAWRPTARPLTTLLPYDSPAGPLVLGARFADERRARLAVALGTGEFRPFADLLLGEEVPDPATSFDPVLHPVPGLAVPEWVRRLREPAYAGARDSRGEDSRLDRSARLGP